MPALTPDDEMALLTAMSLFEGRKEPPTHEETARLLKWARQSLVYATIVEMAIDGAVALRFEDGEDSPMVQLIGG